MAFYNLTNMPTGKVVWVLTKRNWLVKAIKRKNRYVYVDHADPVQAARTDPPKKWVRESVA